MAPRGERRNQIVQAARSRFTTLGYDGTTIGDIASDLDISKAAIAYYFPTKETFLDEFVSPFIDDLEQRLDGLTEPHATLRAYLGAIVEHHDVATWFDTDAALQNDPNHGGRLAEINRRVTEIIAVGDETADEIRAHGVLGGLWRPAREVSTDDLVAHFDEIVDAALASV